MITDEDDKFRESFRQRFRDQWPVGTRIRSKATGFEGTILSSGICDPWPCEFVEVQWDDGIKNYETGVEELELV